ncbi:mitochondrial antiviral-signaling protein [Aquila chrysaetos chrysaetos]|uniref:Mitochondrial antiviral signaling protein n=1 Tax=Aquila chrysaetos chrysaetos TaxID=223781 RepID=A0A663DJN9_AQUCH|nr:mitochondrial antiviral-signaling protein [Aquila chrysaetos chrysaetos]XP_029877347.1 mitochondrial antiviral-signaling protein [Aquila chrysaetos chrysaetos]
MGFAEDKVYDYILQNLKNFKNIRVASLADSLSCLTDADRDELHTREEMRGSQATVYKFYQHLKCRQGWVPDLIDALRQNNAGHLADELQRVYDSWQARSPAPAAAFFPPAASGARPDVSSVGAQMPSPGPNPAPGAPLTEQPRRDLPAGSRPLLLPSAATATSTDLDARAPVQESLPKNLEQESLQPPPLGSAACDGASDGHSGEKRFPHPIEATQVAVGTPGAGSVAVPLTAPPERGRDWLSRQQHPVCVDNGCFGNANHLHRGAPGLGLGRSLPPRYVGSARSPEQPRNEPEEDFYASTESPPRLEEAARSEGPQPPDSLPKKQVVPGSEHGEAPGSFVDVRSPLLIQQQFDAEQKQVGKLREDRGDGDTQMETTIAITTPASRDAAPSWDTSLKPPVQERKLPAGETASSTPSMLTKEKVLPTSADPLPTVAGGFEGTSGRTASRVSSAMSVWASCSNVESDAELSKPGILLSVAGEGPEASGRCQSSQGPSGPYSGASNRLTFSSDPLMVSTDSSSSGEVLSRVSLGCPAPVAHEDPGGEEAAGASRDSCPPPSWDSTSLGTHEVRVDHYPRAQLRADNDLQDGAGPLGNSQVFDSSRGHDTATSSSQVKVPPGDSNGPSLPYIVPAVGIAVISAVAFLVYARLQK